MKVSTTFILADASLDFVLFVEMRYFYRIFGINRAASRKLCQYLIPKSLLLFFKPTLQVL